MNTILKFVLKTVLVISFLIIAIEGCTKYFFHDTIVEKLKAVSKKALESSLTFSDVSISTIKHFPNLSITIDSLFINEQEYEIVRVGLVELQIDVFDLYDDNFIVSEVLIEDAIILAPVDSLGNKHMIKPRQIKNGEIEQGNTKIKFDIPRIIINRAKILVDNKFKGNRFVISVDSGRFRLKSFDDLLEFKGDAYATLDTMISKGKLSFTDLPLMALATTFRVNTLDRKKLFDGTLGVADARLKAYGVLSPVGNGNILDLTLDGDNGSLDSFMSIFPVLKGLGFYQSNPDAIMKLKVYQSGFIGPMNFPNIDINFELKYGQFTRNGLNGVLDSVSLKGTYSNGKLGLPVSSSFVIDYGTAKFEDSFITMKGSVLDFSDPILDFQASSQIDLEDIKMFLEYPNLTMNGSATIDMDLHGKLSDLKLKDVPTIKGVKTDSVLAKKTINQQL